MDNYTLLQSVILLSLLLSSGFFSSAETALMTVNTHRLRSLADRGNKNAAILLTILQRPEKVLSAILIGNNIVNLSASALATTLTLRLFGSYAVSIVTGVLTLLILVFGEIMPKNLANLYAETIALSYAFPIRLLIFLLTPLICIVNGIARGVSKLLGADPEKKKDAITEEELRTIVEVSHEEGIIENEERKMINNVFDFGETLARDIMVPRIDIAFISVDASYDELLAVFRKERYTRIPVYEETTDNVIGVINVKDLLLTNNKENFTIRDYLRKPLYTYEFKKTAELMLDMKKSYSNIAIVLDEYGVTAGLITIEDMLEEIVGDIRDEYDADEADDFIQLSEGEYLIDGSMKLDEINELLGTKILSEDYDSLGGFIMGELGRLPARGRRFFWRAFFCGWKR